MLAKYLTLLLVILPSVIYAGIVIKIKPTKNGDDTSVDFLGEDLALINDKERELFKIDDETLKKASETLIGKRCTNVFLEPSTLWGDLYKTYGWDPVRRTIKPIEAKVIGVNSNPVAVKSDEYINSHNSLDVTFSTSLTHQVDEAVEHTWSTGGESGFKQEITYEVNYGIASVGGSTAFSHTGSWGEDNTKSRKVTIGSTSTILTVVPPGNSVLASLIATHGLVDIEIRYSTSLTGKVVCNYNVPYRGHHFYAMSINAVQKVVDTPIFIYSTEKVSVSFYNSVKLEVTNSTVS